MKGLVSRRVIGWLAGAFLTLLAFAVASPGQALAGCLHDGPTVAHFEHLVRLGAMPEAETPSPEREDRPCSGPMCSRLPAAPTVPATVSFAYEPWACLAAGPMGVPPHFSFLATEVDRAIPVGGPASIFHPPRSSSC